MKINPIKMRAYKVVYRDYDNVLHSAISDVRRSRYGLVYVPFKLIKPMIGRIMVFGCLGDARDFRYKNTDLLESEIWEVAAYGNVQLVQVAQLRFIEESFEECWNGSTHSPLRKAPTGTIGCKSIKLVKKVS